MKSTSRERLSRYLRPATLLAVGLMVMGYPQEKVESQSSTTCFLPEGSPIIQVVAQSARLRSEPEIQDGNIVSTLSHGQEMGVIQEVDGQEVTQGVTSSTWIEVLNPVTCESSFVWEPLTEYIANEPVDMFYVAPDGRDTGDGSQANPWDIETAFDHPPQVGSGDIIFLRNGVYVGNHVSELTGKGSQNIIVRSYPGEWAVLRGEEGVSEPVLSLVGSHTIYWGFEVVGPITDRVTDEPGSHPETLIIDFITGVHMDAGDGNKLVNTIVHDTGNAIGFWTRSLNATLYGNIVFNNGWIGPDRGHGHGTYTQNRAVSLKVIQDNIYGFQMGKNLVGYGVGAYFNRYLIEGNILFKNDPSQEGSIDGANFVIGGDEHLAEDIILRNNFMYGALNDIGYIAGCNDVSVTGNYFANVNHISLLVARDCQPSIEGNIFSGTVGGFWSDEHPNNQYDVQGDVFVSVRENQYESERANIAIFNPDHVPYVFVDVSEVLEVGQQFELRDAQNIFGEPVLDGVYNGQPLRIPMELITVSLPQGLPAPQHTSSDFGSFVLLGEDPTMPRVPVYVSE